ncbi:MAG: hypothetical protein ACREEM_51295 [Blastocatellia bacterium]
MLELFQKEKSYTFADYFELANPTEEIVAEFGYGYELTNLEDLFKVLLGILKPRI